MSEVKLGRAYWPEPFALSAVGAIICPVFRKETTDPLGQRTQAVLYEYVGGHLLFTCMGRQQRLAHVSDPEIRAMLESSGWQDAHFTVAWPQESAVEPLFANLYPEWAREASLLQKTAVGKVLSEGWLPELAQAANPETTAVVAQVLDAGHWAAAHPRPDATVLTGLLQLVGDSRQDGMLDAVRALKQLGPHKPQAWLPSDLEQLLLLRIVNWLDAQAGTGAARRIRRLSVVDLLVIGLHPHLTYLEDALRAPVVAI